MTTTKAIDWVTKQRDPKVSDNEPVGWGHGHLLHARDDKPQGGLVPPQYMAGGYAAAGVDAMTFVAAYSTAAATGETLNSAIRRDGWLGDLPVIDFRVAKSLDRDGHAEWRAEPTTQRIRRVRPTPKGPWLDDVPEGSSETLELLSAGLYAGPPEGPALPPQSLSRRLALSISSALRKAGEKQ